MLVYKCLVLSYWKYLSISSFIFKLFGETKLLTSASLLLFSIKSINSIQKYPNIIESHACILWILAVMFLLSLNFLNSEMHSTLKLSKYVTILPFTYKAIIWAPMTCTYQKLLYIPYPLSEVNQFFNKHD